MFGFLGDIVKDVGDTIGTVTGSIIGISVGAIAITLGMTESMVRKAKSAGCETYEEIVEFWED